MVPLHRYYYVAMRLCTVLIGCKSTLNSHQMSCITFWRYERVTESVMRSRLQRLTISHKRGLSVIDFWFVSGRRFTEKCLC